LSAELGRTVLLKRDDLTGLALGGNKVRKLEFLLGAAEAEGADTVVTFGALQSNHARQTAAACAARGLRCELVLTTAVDRSGEAYERGGNVLLDRLFGAGCTIIPNDDALMAATVAEVRDRIAARGGRARWIPPGGSDAVGTLGYVAAGLELAEQLRATVPDGRADDATVHVAVSTGGTLAGLLTGLQVAGCGAEVRGVDVYRPADVTLPRVLGLLDEVADLLGVEAVPAGRVHLDDGWIGDGYGLPTAAMVEAVRLVARTEGVLLDPVYSGKAMAGLVADCRADAERPGGPTVFVHTGGAPGLFAYPDVFGP
jgi:D-cysteine desulfhydrase family pyridoxal phosphate-dependent enzyme